MRRSSRILFRLAIAAFVLLLLMLAVVMLIPDTAPQPTPLPFSTNGYFATSTFEIFPSHLPPHASFKARLSFVYFKMWQTLDRYHQDPTNTTFAALPVGPQSIDVLLDECMQVSGTRYLMPSDIVVGNVRFGSSNALNGRQWITSCENALQTGRPSIRDPKTGRMHQENLVLIRYPEQKAVLVLPASGVQEFRRTNSTGVIDQIAR